MGLKGGQGTVIAEERNDGVIAQSYEIYAVAEEKRYPALFQSLDNLEK